MLISPKTGLPVVTAICFAASASDMEENAAKMLISCQSLIYSSNRAITTISVDKKQLKQINVHFYGHVIMSFDMYSSRRNFMFNITIGDKKRFQPREVQASVQKEVSFITLCTLKQ